MTAIKFESRHLGLTGYFDYSTAAYPNEYLISQLGCPYADLLFQHVSQILGNKSTKKITL